eukprot:3791813-Karenia_brevis.AAC.1
MRATGIPYAADHPTGMGTDPSGVATPKNHFMLLFFIFFAQWVMTWAPTAHQWHSHRQLGHHHPFKSEAQGPEQ